VFTPVPVSTSVDVRPGRGHPVRLESCLDELELAAGTSALEESFSRAVDAYATAPPVQPKPAAIRNWAREAGLDVPDKGRIPMEVRAAWDAAHQT
jgi:hypothetical protein